MTYKNFFGVFVSLVLFQGEAVSGCFDGLTTSNSVYSKIRGFYITRESAGDDTFHSVILDKATCTASPSGGITLVGTTLSHYYLKFKSKDKTLYSSLLSAQARDIVVEFRLAPATIGNANEIAYIITPSGARSQ
jgi:hypothetical protein